MRQETNITRIKLHKWKTGVDSQCKDDYNEMWKCEVEYFKSRLSLFFHSWLFLTTLFYAQDQLTEKTIITQLGLLWDECNKHNVHNREMYMNKIK